LLAEWLQGHNERHIRKKSWILRLDVYSLWESFDEVKYLENKDLTIKKPLDAFNCFEPYKEGRTGVRPCDASGFVVLRR
jgi:hypothetical protein